MEEEVGRCWRGLEELLIGGMALPVVFACVFGVALLGTKRLSITA